MQTPQGYSSVTAGHYIGSGAPSSMYIGVQPYGSSLSLSMPPPYDVHVPSAYHYSYGIHLSGGSNPYRPLPPLLWWLNHRVYDLGFIQKRKQRKVLKTFYGKSDNDWVCPNCGNVNFSFRTICNMRKCNTPKRGSQASKSGKNSKGDMPDGSWKCDQCNNINYPFRTKCSRQNYGAEKPSESGKSPLEEAEENDQLLIGLFNLDPTRVFDIVLECFKLHPDNNVFLNLIPVFPKLARTCYNFYQSTPTKLAGENYLHSGQLMFKSLFVIYTRWTTTIFFDMEDLSFT
ncbi:unnamed protein product [Lactuca saligna]|uniref:RanBP2-type domain-containing protein n=1 Tax=Lactuca saligna TaxID=75948 RepID=A0AA36EDM5_LACSI|nr:unnamed protein product [Lactuca saligna]